MNLVKIPKGRRIGAIDYGRRRIGFAISDELHITITPKEVFYTDDVSFRQKLYAQIRNFNLGALVIGLPLRLDEQETELIGEIKEFAESLRNSLNIPVYFQDESFSSKYATDTMIAIGKKKKQRSKKEEKDKIAACIILRDFINENCI